MSLYLIVNILQGNFDLILFNYYLTKGFNIPVHTMTISAILSWWIKMPLVHINFGLII